MNTLEAMRAETTQLALLHINKNKDLYERYVFIRDQKWSLKKNVEKCIMVAEAWAKKNNNEFGALFEAEIPLVRWNTILKEI